MADLYRHRGLDGVILMPTGKGFALDCNHNLREALLDGYGRHRCRRDVASEASFAIPREDRPLPKLRLAVVTNDSVATMASLAHSPKLYPNSRVVMGLVVGAGCNSTISMKLTDLQELKTRFICTNNPNVTETLVNSEWTLCCTSLPVELINFVTQWDQQVEMKLHRPRFQPLEYMTGGRYVGELVRIIAYDYMANILGIPENLLPTDLMTEFKITTDFLSSTVASLSLSDYDLVNELTYNLPPPHPSKWRWSLDTARTIRTIATFVQTRSAALVAAATAGLLACNGEIRLDTAGDTSYLFEQANAVEPLNASQLLRGPEELIVAASGGIIQFYPRYRDTVQNHLDRILIRSGLQEGGKSVLIRVAEDGGLVGVGVLAATSSTEIKRIIGSDYEKERRGSETELLYWSASISRHIGNSPGGQFSYGMDL